MTKCIQCGKSGDLRRGWTCALYCSKRCEIEGVSRVHGSMPGCGSPWMPLHVEQQINYRWQDKEEQPCRLDQTAQCKEAEREKLKASIERLKMAGDAILEFYKNRRHNEFFTFVAGVQKIEADWTAAKEEQP